jgi:hypothetical protein
MTIPAIFHWPSPWLWGAIGVLILADSHGFWDWIQGSAWLVLFASVVYYVRNRTGLGRGTDTLSATPRALDQRLDSIERRLTDTQDVMIAVSEKVSGRRSGLVQPVIRRRPHEPDDCALHHPAGNRRHRTRV